MNIILYTSRFSSDAIQKGMTAAVAMSSLLGYNLPAQAQTDTAHLLEEIVVTAQRREEGLQAVPIAVSAFSAESIESLNFTRSQDFAAQVPGLNWQGGFALGSPQINIRGIGQNGFFGNNTGAVGIYVDDVYLNQTAGHGFHLFDLERVEVLRGPQGTLYGINTTGGAISYISKKPTDELSFSGRADVGNYRYQSFEGTVNLPINDKTALRVAFTREQSDGFANNRFLQRDARRHDTSAIRAILRVNASDTLEVLAKAHIASNDGDPLIYSQQGTLDPVTGALCSPEDIAAFRCVDANGYNASNQQGIGSDIYSFEADTPSVGELDVAGTSLTLAWTLPALSFTSITAYEETQRRATEDLDNSPALFAQDQFDTDAWQITQELRLSSSGDGPLQYIVGLFYMYEEVEEFTPNNFPGFGPGVFSGQTGPGAVLEGIYNAFELENTNLALFGEATYDLNDSISVTAGLRFTSEDKDIPSYIAGIYDITDWTADRVVTLGYAQAREFIRTIDTSIDDSWEELTNRLSLRYEFSDYHMAYLTYSTGFRGGNFNPAAFFSSTELTTVEPETADSLEFGTKSTFWNGRARLNTAFFYATYENQQVTAPQGGIPTFSNAAESTNSGAEFELYLQPTEQLFVQLGAAYLDAEYDEFISTRGGDLSGNKLESAPEFTINGIIRYDFSSRDTNVWFVDTDFSYRDKHFLDFANAPASEQDGYALWNGRLGYRADNWEAMMWIRNITDKEYFVNWFDFSGSGFNQYTTGEPRTFGLSISFNM